MSKKTISNIFKVYIASIVILFFIFQYAQINSEDSFYSEKCIYVTGDQGVDNSIRVVRDINGNAVVEKRANGTWAPTLLRGMFCCGSMLVGGNTASTVIVTKDTFVDLNLNGLAVEAFNNNLWTLTDTTTGEMRYNGNIAVSLDFTGLIAAYSAGGLQRFNFRLLKNGLPLSSPNNVNIPLEIRVNVDSSTLLWSIMVSPGDKFRLQVENTDGTSDITIDTLKVIID
jgi:hypothetical protein